MEPQDQREPARQVHQPVEQAGHQEEQCPQAQQGECVGREDDVGLMGDAETAGIESSANRRSVPPMVMNTMNSGVTTRRPLVREISRPPA